METEETPALDDVGVEEASVEQEMKAKPQDQAESVGNSQRRAVALKVSSALADLDATLQDMSCTEAELQRLDLLIQALNHVLKVRSPTASDQ